MLVSRLPDVALDGHCAAAERLDLGNDLADCVAAGKVRIGAAKIVDHHVGALARQLDGNPPANAA